ncbi:glycosyl transferase family group 2-domain-containing protein [Rhodocollybia butyracea]|uniref:Glycosyl transferase family group 2-domain-containing protein n=1 Tax=Rhodocollybia butyracea TaxID=206335 RepID=A0A9P5PXV1_9AGAR|nr:glycosyl transferase family group 2-domain-containing protein [Rhodocollybia butyracea]
MDYDNYDAVLHYLWARTQGDAWFKPTEENISAGVCLRVEQGHFRVFPYENRYLVPFESAVRQLNPLVAIKVRSAAVHAALATVRDSETAIYLDVTTPADKEQCGAFIRDERVLIVWSDDLDTILSFCSDFEMKLVKLVWRSRASTSGAASLISNGSVSGLPSTTTSDVNLTEKPSVPSQAPPLPSPAEKTEKPKPKSKWNIFSWKISKKTPQPASDLEKGSAPPPRPTRLYAPFYGGFGAGLSVFFIGCGTSTLIQEYRLDHDWRRFLLLVTTPFLFCISLFFALQALSSVTFLFGPVSQYDENSRYYSAVPPGPNPEVDSRLPHVTVELPVYRESLEETIAPSVHSLKKAMQTYARQGGTSSIFVHDDGLQIISPEEREERIQFYANHNIGWVARPRHSNDADGFKRAGRFKKASNMNYGLALSMKMEAKLVELEALQASGASNQEADGICLEDKALQMAIEEVYEENGKKWKPWACNGRSIRMGDVILIVDSDTIVPEDCFRDAARELAECPDVAIIQHESDVMQVAHHFFENGIAHFTRRINKCISMGCANGEVAPFVGHNAFLRWSAIQDAAFIDPDDGVKKIWSESNVSEDFDMALRLQLQGYIIRWATYSDGGFKEGVSLTVDDELNRWQKYAYGCNELMFNPLFSWWKMGPITKQLRTFIWSEAPVHYKISMMSYMFSYYGLAGSAMLSVLNYFLLGWAADIDGYYLHSFEIWLACCFVFPIAGNVGFTLLEYRLGRRSILSGLIENFAWIPFFFFFFGGLSIHLSAALLAHMFSYNIKWEATKKLNDQISFIEVPRIWKRYRHIMILGAIAIATMIVLTLDFVPEAWRIPSSDWAIILPLS